MLRVYGEKMMEFYVNCAKNLKMFKLMSMTKGGNDASLLQHKTLYKELMK